MKIFLVLLALFMLSGAVMAQSGQTGKVTGSLADSVTAKPVPYATVSLLNGTKLITGATTDEAGAFVLANVPLGSYKLVLSFVGYRTQNIPLTLTAERPALDLGTLKLGSDSKLLSGVTVTG